MMCLMFFFLLLKGFAFPISIQTSYLSRQCDHGSLAIPKLFHSILNTSQSSVWLRSLAIIVYTFSYAFFLTTCDLCRIMKIVMLLISLAFRIGRTFEIVIFICIICINVQLFCFRSRRLYYKKNWSNKIHFRIKCMHDMSDN